MFTTLACIANRLFMKPIELIKPYFVEKRYHVALGMISLIIVDMLQLFIPRIIKWTVDDLTLLNVGRGVVF